jgi:tetratricopeptide (TPR) repeat protein
VTASAASGVANSTLEALQEEFLDLSRADSDNHIEVAIRYARCGNYADAIHLLELVTGESEKVTVSPLVYYYQAYYYSLIGQSDKALTLLKKASGTDPKYCFPYRHETFPVLEWALSENPDDALAHYFLGFLLKKRTRLTEAVAHWERSVVLDPLNVVAQRNLGQSYYEQGDLQKALHAYQLAIQADPSAGLAIVELGLINKELKISYNEQIGLFEDHMAVVSEYNEAVSQLIELYVVTGRNRDALKLLNSTHFNSWEGKYGIHQLWVQSNIKQGDSEFEKGNVEEALWYYQQSLLYPEHLEVAEQPNTIHARKKYKIGMALEALGRRDQAREYYEIVVADKVADGNAYQYYRARALEALKEKQAAKRVYEKMLEALQQSESDLEQAISLYTRSLALEGLGKNKEAEANRSKAFDLYPLVELSAFRPPRAGF